MKHSRKFKTEPKILLQVPRFEAGISLQITNIFYECIHLKSLWQRLGARFQNDIILPSLTPQAAILGLTNEASNIYNLLNHIFLIFKYYVYRSRDPSQILHYKIFDIIANLDSVGGTTIPYHENFYKPKLNFTDVNDRSESHSISMMILW